MRNPTTTIEPLTMAHLTAMGEANSAANRALLTGFDGAECYALLHDGTPIAAAGITIIRPGVGLAWSKQTEEVSQSAFLFRRMHEAVKKIWPVLLAEMKLERIEAHAKADSAKACRWLEYFGFEREAVRMRKFVEGQDYSLFAKVRD